MLVLSTLSANTFAESTQIISASNCEFLGSLPDANGNNSDFPMEDKFVVETNHNIQSLGRIENTGYYAFSTACAIPVPTHPEGKAQSVDVTVYSRNRHDMECHLVKTDVRHAEHNTDYESIIAIGRAIHIEEAVETTFNTMTLESMETLHFQCAIDQQQQVSGFKVVVADAPIVGTQAPWSDNDSGTLTTGVAWNYTMGYSFTPNVNGTITGLGGLFDGTKTVSLYNKGSAEFLASTEVTSTNEFAYSSISPVSVEAGVTYTVAVTLGGTGGSYRNSLSENFPQDFGDITIEGSTYVSGTGRPTNNITTTMYGQADIKFVAD